MSETGDPSDVPDVVEREVPKGAREAGPDTNGIGDVVASHYNNLQERGKAARTESRFVIQNREYSGNLCTSAALEKLF